MNNFLAAMIFIFKKCKGYELLMWGIRIVTQFGPPRSRNGNLVYYEQYIY